MDARPPLTLTDLGLDCLESICLHLAGADGDACALAPLAATSTSLRSAARSALARLTRLDLTPPRVVAMLKCGSNRSGGGASSSASSSSSPPTRPPTPAQLAATAPLITALLSRATSAVTVDLSRGHAYVTDATLAALGRAGRTLKEVRLSHCTRLTPSGLAALGAAAPHLTSLALAGVPAAGEPGVLDGFALEELDVAWVRDFGGGGGGSGGRTTPPPSPSPSSGFRGGGRREVTPPLCRRALTRATLRGCEGVGDATLSSIISPSLTHLDLAFTAVSDAGLAAVAAGAPALRTLVVANSERCDQVWSTGFYSAGGLRRFRAAAPGVEVVLVAS